MTIGVCCAPSRSSVPFFWLALGTYSIKHFINHTITWIESENRIIEKVVMQSPSCLDLTSSERAARQQFWGAHMDQLHRLVVCSSVCNKHLRLLVCLFSSKFISVLVHFQVFISCIVEIRSKKNNPAITRYTEHWECGNFQNGSKPSRADGKGGQGGS